MIVFDTDHLSVLQHEESAAAERLLNRLDAKPGQQLATTVISLEEQARGWLAEIRRQKSPFGEVLYYDRLGGLVRFYSKWTLLPFDGSSATIYAGLRQRRLRIGSSDLKIASIALARSCRLISANLRDFQQVPGLLVEDWLHDASGT